MLIASRDRRRGYFGALSVPIYNVHVLSELSYWNEDLNPASCVCPEIIGYEVIFEAWGVAVAGSSIAQQSLLGDYERTRCQRTRFDGPNSPVRFDEDGIGWTTKVVFPGNNSGAAIETHRKRYAAALDETLGAASRLEGIDSYHLDLA